MEKHANTIEYEVYGDYALFSDPVVRVGGEKTSYSIPTYEALRGITESIFWKPTISWVIDEIRVMNRIQTETKGIRPIKYNGGNELAYYTYLKDVRYQVHAHFEFNEHQVNMVQDRNERKYQCMSERMVKSGGRRDIFLGTRECQAFEEPCTFGEGENSGIGSNAFRVCGLWYYGNSLLDCPAKSDLRRRMCVFGAENTKNIIVKISASRQRGIGLYLNSV